MFEKVEFKDIQNYAYEKLGKEGCLLVCGTENDHNNMTIGWATYGILWSKPVAISYVKPTRHTFLYSNKYDTFSICYFENQKEILKICGTKSGRDINKDEVCNLHVKDFNGIIGYEEADLVITCKKIYQDDLKEECFLDKSIVEKRYLDNKIHRFYVGEVVEVFKKTN